MMLLDHIRPLEASSGECRELIDEPPKHRSKSTFRRSQTSIGLSLRPYASLGHGTEAPFEHRAYRASGGSCFSDNFTNFVLPLKAVTTFQELGIIAQGTLSDLPELDAP